jgi:hypothetical protein
LVKVRVLCEPRDLRAVCLTTLETAPQLSSQHLAVFCGAIPEEPSLKEKQLADLRLEEARMAHLQFQAAML